MKKHLFSFVKIAVFLGLGIFLIWLVIKNLTPADKQEIKGAFWDANYWWLLVSAVFAFASHWSRAVRWKMLLEPMGYHPSTTNSFLAVMVGYLANLAVPRLGEVTRCGILNRYEKIPIHKSVGTVVTERAFDLLTLVILFFVVFITQFQRLGAYAQNFIIDPMKEKLLASTSQGVLFGAVVVLAIIGLLILRSQKERIKQIPILERFIDVIRGFIDGLKTIRKLKNPWLFIGHSLFIWVGYFGMLYVCFFCLKQTAHLNYSAGLSVLAFGSIAMIVTPGGIGAYPPIVRGILGLYGVDPNIGLAFGWIAWSGQTLLILLVGFISIAILPVVNNSPANDKAQNIPVENPG